MTPSSIVTVTSPATLVSSAIAEPSVIDPSSMNLKTMPFQTAPVFALTIWISLLAPNRRRLATASLLTFAPVDSTWALLITPVPMFPPNSSAASSAVQSTSPLILVMIVAAVVRPFCTCTVSTPALKVARALPSVIESSSINRTVKPFELVPLTFALLTTKSLLLSIGLKVTEAGVFALPPAVIRSSIRMTPTPAPLLLVSVSSRLAFNSSIPALIASTTEFAVVTPGLIDIVSALA